MRKRRKRFVTRQPEEFERLDEQLTKALENLAERNRETAASLGKFASVETDSRSQIDPRQTTGPKPDGESSPNILPNAPSELGSDADS